MSFLQFILKFFGIFCNFVKTKKKPFHEVETVFFYYEQKLKNYTQLTTEIHYFFHHQYSNYQKLQTHIAPE